MGTTSQRFVDAQDAGGTYERALAELRAGRKTSHWMWFVFPQIAGLGQSAMAQRYAIASLDEARAYLAHPMLGPRLVECASAVAGHGDRFGGAHSGRNRRDEAALVDDSLRSCGPRERVFAQVLEQFFTGPDAATERRL